MLPFGDFYLFFSREIANRVPPLTCIKIKYLEFWITSSRSDLLMKLELTNWINDGGFAVVMNSIIRVNSSSDENPKQPLFSRKRYRLANQNSSQLAGQQKLMILHSSTGSAKYFVEKAQTNNFYVCLSVWSRSSMALLRNITTL